MRTALACNFSPLFLRIALAVTFIWAGASKVFYVDEFSGAAAAKLANAGVQAAIDAAGPAQAPEILPVPLPPPAGDGEAGEADEEVSDAKAVGPFGAIVPVRYQDAAAAGASAPTTTYTAEQFSEGRSVKLRRLNGLILAMHSAKERGQWPDFLATPAAYGAMAWAAALTELFAGVFLLVGFLSRLAGLGVAGVMAGAMWMTQIGPNVGADGALLGFLPNMRLDEAAAWTSAWKDLLWQFTLFMVGLAIFFSGPGRLSIDGLLFPADKSSSRAVDDDE